MHTSGIFQTVYKTGKGFQKKKEKVIRGTART